MITKDKKLCAESVKPDCRNCLYMATHEKCNADGGCLNTKEDFEKIRAGSKMEFRYANFVLATLPQAMARHHAQEVLGSRNIILGPGEAEVSTTASPEENSESLHRVAEDCGYMVDRLKGDREGLQTLMVYKDFGPFRVEWRAGQIWRVMVVEEGKPEREYWHVLWTIRSGKEA